MILAGHPGQDGTLKLILASCPHSEEAASTGVPYPPLTPLPYAVQGCHHLNAWNSAGGSPSMLFGLDSTVSVAQAYLDSQLPSYLVCDD